ncbi:MAG: hypothetical protein IPP18_14655 [Rhodocyclaceae bacterium]|nr:hypothetical protein [Rhodocyclaceae bacterium]
MTLIHPLALVFDDRIDQAQRLPLDAVWCDAGNLTILDEDKLSIPLVPKRPGELSMRIVVCVKEVLNPTRSITTRWPAADDRRRRADTGSRRRAEAINGYDEQAMEAALRIRDEGVECRIVAVSIGADQKNLLKHCAALGADEIVAIAPGDAELDGNGLANILSAYIKGSGGADLVLCGRQASMTTKAWYPSRSPKSWQAHRAPGAGGPGSGRTITVTRDTRW